MSVDHHERKGSPVAEPTKTWGERIGTIVGGTIGLALVAVVLAGVAGLAVRVFRLVVGP